MLSLEIGVMPNSSTFKVFVDLKPMIFLVRRSKDTHLLVQCDNIKNVIYLCVLKSNGRPTLYLQQRDRF